MRITDLNCGRIHLMNDAAPFLDTEPVWPVVVAVLAVGGLYAALAGNALHRAARLALLPVMLCVLEVPTLLAHHTGRYHIHRILGFFLSSLLTAFMLWSLVLLIIALPAHKEQPLAMLRSAAALWVTNILVFAVWYWRLDAGGPHQRAARCKPHIRIRQLLQHRTK